MQCRDTKSFFWIWRSVKRRELYKSNAAIFQCIEKMSNDIDISVPVHHHVDGTLLVVLKKVFLGTMRIVVGFNADPEHDAAHDFDYRKFNLLELIRTHCEFVIVNRHSHFEVSELKQMVSIAQRMTGPQKSSFLATLFSFHASDVDHAINVAPQWLPVFVAESKFVLNTVAQALSTEGAHKLGFAIANYLTSSKVADARHIDPLYMQFLASSVGLCWGLNPGIDLDPSDDELEREQQEATTHCTLRIRKLPL